MAQGLFWKWKRINLETKKEEIILVQGALRPSVMGAWEYVFPEECLADVIAVMGLANSIGAIPTFMNKARLAILRKTFGAEKIPKEIFEEAAKIPPSIVLNDSYRGLSTLLVPGVCIHPIGIKREIRRDFDFSSTGQGKFNQEAL